LGTKVKFLLSLNEFVETIVSLKNIQTLEDAILRKFILMCLYVERIDHSVLIVWSFRVLCGWYADDGHLVSSKHGTTCVLFMEALQQIENHYTLDDIVVSTKMQQDVDRMCATWRQSTRPIFRILPA
jgi:hypothetical protein